MLDVICSKSIAHFLVYITAVSHYGKQLSFYNHTHLFWQLGITNIFKFV